MAQASDGYFRAAEQVRRQEITKKMKTKIGTGGTFKDGQIILQGDHRETVKGLLVEMGFKEESIEVY